MPGESLPQKNVNIQLGNVVQPAKIDGKIYLPADPIGIAPVMVGTTTNIYFIINGLPTGVKAVRISDFYYKRDDEIQYGRPFGAPALPANPRAPVQPQNTWELHWGELTGGTTLRIKDNGQNNKVYLYCIELTVTLDDETEETWIIDPEIHNDRV